MTLQNSLYQTFKRSKVTLLVLITGSSMPVHSGGTTANSYIWLTQEMNNTFEVTSVLNHGTGSLREAIQKANKSPGVDQIIFKGNEGLFNQPQTIYLESPLPEITDDLLIDGYIEDMLWKTSGVTLDGQKEHQIFKIASNVKVKIKYLTLANGHAKNGGAIYSSGELVIESVMLSNNTARQTGGAIYSKGKKAIIYNSTFFENSSKKNGGGVAFLEGENRLTNVTLTQNGASSGGGIYNHSNLSIYNSIVTNSPEGKDCYSTGTIVANVTNIIGTEEGCGKPYSSQDPILSKPNYYNGPTQTLFLGQRSPAINYGSNKHAVDENGKPLRWDQRGNGDPRYASGVTDIGAFETQPQNLIQVDTIDDVDYRWCTVFQEDCSFKGALLLANNEPRFSVITFLPSLFEEKTTLPLSGQLPEITSQITLDASDTGGITIQLDSESPLCNESPFLTLKKVSIKCP